MSMETDKFIREYFEARPQLDPPAYISVVGYAIPAPCLHMIESLLEERRLATAEVADLKLALKHRGKMLKETSENEDRLTVEGERTQAVVDAAIAYRKLWLENTTMQAVNDAEDALFSAVEALAPVSGRRDTDIKDARGPAAPNLADLAPIDNVALYRQALTEITCCESIQQAAIIANGALLKFAPIMDDDIEWAKRAAADSRPTEDSQK